MSSVVQMSRHTGRPVKEQFHMTPEMIARFEQLWAEDHSASQISMHLMREFPDYKGSLSRNAIIGSAARLRERGYKIAPRARPARVKSVARVPRQRKVLAHVLRVRKKKQMAITKILRDHEIGTISGSMMPGPSHDQLDPGVGQFDDSFACVAADADVQPKGLMDLVDGECRWPVGELFCARQCDNTRQSYCPKHGRLDRR
jgi:hypothetical protein